MSFMSECVGGPSIFVKDDVLNLAASASADTSGMVGMKVSIIDTVTCWMTGDAAAGSTAAATASAAAPAPVARALALPVLGSAAMLL